MANDFELRLSKLEGDFNGLREYIPILYGYIDELRGWTQELREEHKESRKRVEQNEEFMREMKREHEVQMREIKDTQSLIGRLLLQMNGKLDDHENRLPKKDED